MSAVAAALATPTLRRALIAYLAFIVVEEAAWLGILLHAHDVGGVSAVGFVAVAQLLPATIMAPISATLVDRLPRKQALVMAYGSISLAMLATGLTIAADAQPGSIYILAIVLTVLITLGRPAHFAALPQIAETPSRLVAANAATSTLEGLGVLVGPATVAMAASFANLAFMFLVLGIALGFATLWLSGAELSRQFPGEQNPPPERESFLNSTVLGVLEVRRIPGAFTLLLLIGMGFVLQGALDVLGVAFAMDVLSTGETGASLLAGANGLGLLVGAAATIVLVGRARLVPVFIISTVLTGIFMALIGATQVLLVAAGLVLCSGFSRAFTDVAGRTLLHRNVSERAMARVFGIQEMVLNGGMALGAALTPLVVATVGPREAFVVIGMMLPALAVAGLGFAGALDQAGERAARALSLFRSVSLFAPLHADSLEWLANSAELTTLPAGHKVVREGEHGDRFYVIGNGSVRVIRGGSEVARIKVGGYFGEAALINDAPRNATVETLEPVELLILEREVFLHAVAGSRPATDECRKMTEASTIS